MISRKDLFKSVFNRQNVLKTLDSVLPVDLPEPEPFYDIPELSGEMLYYEAMKLGIDPSTLPPDKLKQKVMDKMLKSQKKHTPSDAGTALAGGSVNG